MNHEGKKSFSLFLLVFLIIGAIAGAVLLYAYKTGERKTGEELLHAFYTFDLETVSENDKRIAELTNQEVYERFTISSSTRQMRVYLKFAGNPVEAKIIRHEGNKIMYYIKSKDFLEDRTFVLEYDYSWGKIVGVREYEVFLLPQTLRSDFE